MGDIFSLISVPFISWSQRTKSDQLMNTVQQKVHEMLAEKQQTNGFT